ncbi:metallophosphoesterase [Thermoproteota archaeon]
MKIIIVSDCHFGYEDFNTSEFDHFLKYLEDSKDIDRIVFLGDVFDFWRADPVDALFRVNPYLERIRRLNVRTDYIVGNHDYHNWVSCIATNMIEFLWMNIHYPYLVIDNIFLTHGDYFDIYANPLLREAIYSIYEAIYHLDEPTVSILERYFYEPYKLVKEWLRRYRKVKPTYMMASEKAPFIPQDMDYSLEMVLEKTDTGALERLEKGLEYLNNHQDLAVQLFVPSSERQQLLTQEIPKFLQTKPRQEYFYTLEKVDRTQYVRSITFKEGILEKARKISKNLEVTKVIYGHTHRAELNPTEGYCNTGSWTEGESTFVEIVNGKMSLYRMISGSKTEIS